MSLTKQQALELFRSDDLIGIGMEAEALRRKLHPEGVVTYIIDRNINYTNYCTEYCTFCAFYRPLKGPKAKEGYILDFDTIYEKLQEEMTPPHFQDTGVSFIVTVYGRPLELMQPQNETYGSLTDQLTLVEIDHAGGADVLLDPGILDGARIDAEHPLGQIAKGTMRRLLRLQDLLHLRGR